MIKRAQGFTRQLYIHEKNIRDLRLAPLCRQSEDQQVALCWLRMVPGIPMTGKLKEEEKQEGEKKEARVVVAGKPHVLLSGDSIQQLQLGREAATHGLVSHQQRAQLLRVKQQSGFNMDSL